MLKYSESYGDLTNEQQYQLKESHIPPTCTLHLKAICEAGKLILSSGPVDAT